jgi:hypothetical protein
MARDRVRAKVRVRVVVMFRVMEWLGLRLGFDYGYG